MKSLYSIFSVSAIVLFYACNSTSNNQSNNSAKPILLGDSTQIVTEKDSQYLKDGVMDVKEQPIVEDKKIATKGKSIQASLTTEDKSQPAPTQMSETNIETTESASIKGFDINCGDYKIVLGGNASFKEYVKQNPITANMIGYAVLKGSISNIKVGLSSNVKNAKAFQKTNYTLTLNGPSGNLNLPKYSGSTGWAPLINANNVFSLKSPESLVNINLNPRQLEQEALNMLRKQRVKHNVMTAWQSYLRKIKSSRDLNAYFSLGNTEVRLSGATAKGRLFSKVVRLDGGK